MSVRTPSSDLDLADPAFVADPYDALRVLRESGPVVRHEPSGRWLATTHAAVGATLRHRGLGRIWSDHEPTDQLATFNALHRHQMMENEPPAHTRLRSLVASAFARGHVERLRPRVEAIAHRLLDDVEAADLSTFDLLGDYAEPLPVLVVADLLGVPSADHALLRDWSQAIVGMYETGVGVDVRAAAARASEEFDAYVRALVAERVRHPGDDLVSDLVAAREPTDGAPARLSEDELVASVVLLLNAGHEASVNVFGNGAHALLAHPDQLARVRSGEVSAERAVEEMIRFDSALQLFERTATADVEVAGTPVAPGEVVATLLGAANRDPAVFTDPTTFDVGRDPNPHVGFGMGRHFCLGAPLARMELATSLQVLLERVPRLAPAGTPRRRPTFVLRGFATLPVTTA